MSENYEPVSPGRMEVASTDAPTTLETAKHEAADLKDTAVEQAKDVADTVKDEASVVLSEAKSQAKELYGQTQRELTDQANTQQQRIAAGLHSVSSELRSMSQSSQNPGVATDLVRQLSGRLAGAATWLGDRDTRAVLTEVKRYARRKPGTFILGAAIAGVVIGRLTRALASNASDDNPGVRPSSGAGSADSQWSRGATAAPVTIADEDTPVYAQAATVMDAGHAEGGGDVRPDSF